MKGTVTFSLMFLWASFGYARFQRFHLDASSSNFFDVLDYGAVGDGKTDDSPAFLKAWAKACAIPHPSTLIVPSGKMFLLKPVTFQGPCKATNINFQIFGNIIAPDNVWAWKGFHPDHWITFSSINGLIITGSGHIDGQGSSWWECRSKNKCSSAPTAVFINSCNNFHLNGLKFINSPQMHLVLDHCTGVHISHIKIMAPEDSPNTDGIHLGGCKHVEIVESTIGTGDDCISIGTDCSDVKIRGISCGPGHGISVGSLGAFGSYSAVEQIHVSNCTFHGTMNGVRIKTWQGGYGFARGIKFEDITMKSVDNPIIIDQYYCNGDHNCVNKTSGVKVTDVSFTRVRGSSTDEVAIKLACSKTVACTDVHIDNVQLMTTDSGKDAVSFCLNAHGTSNAPVSPAVPCLV